ncbi:hypothetical protein SAMN04488058_10759 [Deinococcus reticulitermitis]|uniref:Amine oxidase domain-containing protein n=2 Tax=Deinococcus reticulitermitis TaxID=856736 RepID=A0A1H6YBZ9_9DEIO|nr:hypothetical protein SAMN04488058_10759 [Deinococcus reticulitermitis]
MTDLPTTELLVIGAGLGGLACAADVQRAGEQVRVLDKARGVSGRAATRRVTLPGEAGGEARLDHGARFFTARSERLRQLAGALELPVWALGFPTWEGGRITPEAGAHPRYVPADGLSALGKALARGLDVRTGQTVTRLEKEGGGWTAHTAEGEAFRAARVVLNLPAPQAAALASGVPELQGALAAVEYQPCWTVGAVLEADLPGAEWPALRVAGHPVIDWVAREHTKRPPGHPPALIVQAHGEWSRAHLEAEKPTVEAALLAAVREVTGTELRPRVTFAHRWRYAQPTRRVLAPHFWDAGHGLGACGDGFTPDPHGSRVEAALLSGWSLGEALGG